MSKATNTISSEWRSSAATSAGNWLTPLSSSTTASPSMQRAAAGQRRGLGGEAGEALAPVEPGARVDDGLAAGDGAAPADSRRTSARRSSRRPRAASRRWSRAAAATNAGSLAFAFGFAAAFLAGSRFSICRRVRSVLTDLRKRAVRLSSSSANSSRSLMSSQFSRFSFVCMRTSTQRPFIRSPCATNLISPLATASAGSPLAGE